MSASPYSSNSYNPENENNTWYKMLHMVPEGASVLDIGCSSGNLGAALVKERKAQVDGVDITKSDVELAKKHLQNAWVSDIENDEKLPFEKTYDVIIFADVLEHMKDPVGVLTRIKKFLKPDGIVVFSIPNMAHISIRLQLLEGNFTYTETGLLDYTHLHFYNESEVRRIFDSAGYNIDKFNSTTFDYPPKLIKEKLSNLGLKPNEDFLQLAAEKQAVIFEYVGYASMSKSKAKAAKKYTPLVSSPTDEVASYIKRLEDSYESQIKDLKEKNELTNAHVEKLETIITVLQQEKEDLERSRNHLKSIYEKIVKNR
jgi:2-polyprenyl-3-methyl-5-hydroxy-6-metoxy-1,4-benzoquinol methylase